MDPLINQSMDLSIHRWIQLSVYRPIYQISEFFISDVV